MIPLVNKNAHKRTAEGFKACVDKIGCEPEAVEAVIAIEAAGRGWDRQGRLRMLFEPHVFYREINRHDRDNLEAAQYAGLAYRKWGEKPYPKDSYPRLESARQQFNEELALRSASWGLPQILGENFEASGYNSATDMVTSFLAGEDEQLKAMSDFIVSIKGDIDLRNKNYPAFFEKYNGKGYKKNDYDTKFYSALAKAKRRTAISKVATGTATASTVGAPVGGGGIAAVGGDTMETGVVVVALLALGGAAWLFAKWNASRQIVSDYKPMPKIDDEDERDAGAALEPTEILPPSSLTEIEKKAASVRACQDELARAIQEFEDAYHKARDKIEADRAALSAVVEEISTIKLVPAPEMTAPIEPAPAAPVIEGE